MNEILQLKGQFQQRPSPNKPGSPSLPRGASVSSRDLTRLKEELINVLKYWENNTVLDDILVSVFYKQTIAKSNRIKGLLTKDPMKIVGARYTDDKNKKHIITHYIGRDIVNDTIQKLDACISILDVDYNGVITNEELDLINKNTVLYNYKEISKTTFAAVIVDAYYVEMFDVWQDVEDIDGDAIITIYKTNLSTDTILRKLGLDPLSAKRIDETTMLLYPDQYAILKQKAPYLIAMATSDLSSYTKGDFEPSKNSAPAIPSPTNEPIIGVIDTLFSEEVYFSEWVDYKCMVSEDIPTSDNDYFHGTAISSIIVDGASCNPELNDGCGRFRVRHFGVATSGKSSSFSILQAIKEIIRTNRDIKVWNLSLGSDMPINQNFISPEAAELDKLQYENDVIFIVAGTNKKHTEEQKRIGAPADSINALVVNSVDVDNTSAVYSRVGPVLSFFHKPDVSYYGGCDKQKIKVYTKLGGASVIGSSFAAPWISRKMAYLIHIVGMSREVAKALIIDSAAGWQMEEDPSNIIGYGVAPIKIDDIIQTPNDEIKFILMGTSEKYDTYSYNIPVPIVKDKHPFIAKATLCYFPKCSRTQGVDYTNTELDLHFGRVDGSAIKTVNDNKQSDPYFYHLYEKNARALYRKWDNVKHIYEKPKSRSVAKKVYGTGSWGISIKTKERLVSRDGEGINFGVVITLKEMNNVNRINEFIRQCSLKGWLVNRINIDNRLDVYVKAEEEIEFE